MWTEKYIYMMRSRMIHEKHHPVLEGAERTSKKKRVLQAFSMAHMVPGCYARYTGDSMHLGSVLAVPL